MIIREISHFLLTLHIISETFPNFTVFQYLSLYYIRPCQIVSQRKCNPTKNTQQNLMNHAKLPPFTSHTAETGNPVISTLP